MGTSQLPGIGLPATAELNTSTVSRGPGGLVAGGSHDPPAPAAEPPQLKAKTGEAKGNDDGDGDDGGAPLKATL
jgi:hypothetical protein